MTVWLMDAVLASALLMAAVLLLRAPVRRLFGPTVAYALWALPALRFALPPVPDGWRQEPTPLTRAGELLVSAVDYAPEGGAPPIPEPAQVGAFADVGPALWLLGALAFLSLHLGRYALFRARLLRRHRPVRRVGGVRVIISPAAPGPLAFGVLRRYVALPADLGRFDPRERALALAHEFGHHARGDVLANWAALGLLAVHWWNPIAWAAHRAFRADQELANDARVLRRRGGEAAHAYARAILKSAQGGAVAAVCHLHAADQLKGRLRMLKHRPASPRRLFAGGAAVAALFVAGLGLTASGTSAAAAVKAEVGERLGVDLDAVAVDLGDVMPAPPVPPAAPAAVMASTPPAPLAPASVQVPPPPAAPRAAPLPSLPTPPAPPAPPALVGDGQRVIVIGDKDGRAGRRIIRLRDGKGAPYAFGFSDGFPFDPSDLPEIRERRCGGGDRPAVRNETRDGRRIVVICEDRIKRMAERASREAGLAAELAANGADVRHDALRQALQGLRGAREAIQGSAHLTADQKRDALRGVDQGEREIREQIARGD